MPEIYIYMKYTLANKLKNGFLRTVSQTSDKSSADRLRSTDHHFKNRCNTIFVSSHRDGHLSKSLKLFKIGLRRKTCIFAIRRKKWLHLRKAKELLHLTNVD